MEKEVALSSTWRGGVLSIKLGNARHHDKSLLMSYDFIVGGRSKSGLLTRFPLCINRSNLDAFPILLSLERLVSMFFRPQYPALSPSAVCSSSTGLSQTYRAPIRTIYCVLSPSFSFQTCAVLGHLERSPRGGYAQVS